MVRHSTWPSDGSGIGALRTSKSSAASAPVGREAMITWWLSAMRPSSPFAPGRSSASGRDELPCGGDALGGEVDVQAVEPVAQELVVRRPVLQRAVVRPDPDQVAGVVR